jgi:hypothetical protein
MTDDDSNADELQAPTQGRDRGDDAVDWSEVPTDPEPGRLGYECTSWEKISVADQEDQVIFLPSDEEAVADDAFIVLDDDDLCDLVSRR